MVISVREGLVSNCSLAKLAHRTDPSLPRFQCGQDLADVFCTALNGQVQCRSKNWHSFVLPQPAGMPLEAVIL